MAVAELGERETRAAASAKEASDLGLRVEIELKDGKAPTSFRVFRAGLNTSTKGDYVFNEASQAECMAYCTKRGMKTVIDYEHASRYATFSADPQKAGRAAGRCKLECKNGELWATQVKWTPAAVDAIESGEQDLFSPVFTYNPDTMVVGACTQIGLTATPALDNLDSLAAKDGDQPEHMNMEKLIAFLASLGATMSLKDTSETSVALAVAGLKKDNEALLKALEVDNAGAGVGKIQGLLANTVRVAELTAKVASLEGESKKGESKVLIEAALTAKKISPAMRPMLEKMGERDVAELKSFLDVVAPNSIGGAPVTPPPANGAGSTLAPAGATAIAALSEDQRWAARQMGFTTPAQLEKYAAMAALGVKVAPLTPKKDA